MSQISDLREENSRLKAEIELLKAQGDAQTTIDLSIKVSHLISECEKLKAEFDSYKEMMPRMIDSIPWAYKLEREACQKELEKFKAKLVEIGNAQFGVSEFATNDYHRGYFDATYKLSREAIKALEDK